MTLDEMIELLEDCQSEDGYDYFVDLATEPGSEIIETLKQYKNMIETLQQCPDCMATLKLENGVLYFIKHAT